MKLDFKALGKAMMWTGGIMALAFGVALLYQWLGSWFLFGFNAGFLTVLFYHILKD